MKLGLGLGEAKWAGLVGVAFSLSACGSVSAPGEGEVETAPPVASAPGVASPVAASGRRLTALAHASGSAVNFSHFYDETLKITCSFQRDATGTHRCLPEPRSRVLYLDPRCQEEPAIYEEQVSAGQLFVENAYEPTPAAGELPTAKRLFEVSDLIHAGSDGAPDGTQPLLYQVLGGTCQRAYPNSKAAPAVYRVRPRDAADFVAGQLSISSVNGAAQVRRIAAEDGSAFTLGVALADGTPCSLTADGVCAPEWVDVATSLPIARAEPVLLGNGALRAAALRLSGPGGAFLLPAPGSTGHFVAEDGTSCAVVDWADGTLRCLDGDDELLETGYFADASCGARLYHRLDSARRALTDALVRRSLVTEWQSGAIAALRSVTRHAGPVHVLRQQRCEAVVDESSAMVELFGDEPTALLTVDGAAPPVELPRIELVRL